MQRSRIIRNLDGQNSSRILHEDQVTRSIKSLSYLSRHGDVSSTNALPSNPRHELDLGSFSEDITKQIENAFHFGDEEQVTLALPYTSKGHAQEKAADKQDNDVDRGSQKDSSFVTKFRNFTGGSAKTASGADRRSYQTQSSTTSTGGSRSFRSDSVATQDTNLTGTSTIGTTKSALSVTTTKTNNIRPKPLVLPVVSPSYSKYIGSPHDYCFLDLDVIRSETIRPSNITGLLPRSNNARLSHPPKQSSKDKNKSGKPGPNLVIEFEKRVRHIRHTTGTQGNFWSTKTPNLTQRIHHGRKWNDKNLRCTSCLGECPLCGIACCLYEATRRKSASKCPKDDKSTEEHRLIQMIQDMGSRAKDLNRFSKCTEDGGCGRYVCPDCCGACPLDGCRDIQCKECKANPWAPCDWHDG